QEERLADLLFSGYTLFQSVIKILSSRALHRVFYPSIDIDVVYTPIIPTGRYAFEIAGASASWITPRVLTRNRLGRAAGTSGEQYSNTCRQ
ncbi:hypothetical protein, partial [Pseudomonas simiae]|uniref:hypothetical protein n=1 Tax=Pseudomonas simiae TaxID=321846 RepID=UPI001F1DBB0F